MNNHFSEDQFARWMTGQSTSLERRHAMECGQCRAELDRFGAAVSLFRNAVRERIEDRIASHPAVASVSTPQPSLAGGVSMWRWAVMASAVAVIVTCPFLTSSRTEPPQVVEKKVSTETDADAVMRAVNSNLSRTVPQSMEPVLALIPSDQPITESGGVR